MMKIGEIVGLRGTTNGRSCDVHACCGETLRTNDLVKFRSVGVAVGNKQERAIAAVRLEEGVERCTVGFLPVYMLFTQGDLVGKVARIEKTYQGSDNVAEREMDHRMVGVARFAVVND